ncbi:MAG: Bacterial alpha-L-rhamnosidase [Armatimonadetes bacterium]|nr:Bacterial alpha-L-rhamnosidase [Armatimonadota bacterium]
MLLLTLSAGFVMCSLKPSYLRCENLVDPVGIGATHPRLSWRLDSVRADAKDLRQNCYEIVVASDPKNLSPEKADIWSSGAVTTNQSYGISIPTNKLQPDHEYFWKVRVRDQDEKVSDWSPTASFGVGLTDPALWKAEWIGYDKPRDETKELGGHILPPPVFFRRSFDVSKSVKRAVLYCSAFGIADFHLNGSKIGNEYFMPGWTDYEKRVYYHSYDVTKSLHKGENALGAILGEGWYAGYVGFGGQREHYGKHTRLIAQLEIEYSDGSHDTVTTGPDWRASVGPIQYSDFLMGESYDARFEQDGWDSAKFDASSWNPVVTGATSKGALEAFPGDPVRSYQMVKPISVSEPTKGVYVFNLGQNMAGFVRLKVQGYRGQRITIRHAERLNPDNTIYTTNLRTALATETYVCKGTGVEIFEPHFTFHGFQYVEVTGLEKKPGLDLVEGMAISSDTPHAGHLETSDSMLNKLVSNAYWTQRMNFIDIPTDCPQRDERLGWTGDAQAFIRTATYVTDVQPFFTKWLVDLDDGQRADGQYPMVAPVKVAGDDGGPAWADAGVICPWTIWQVYGDKQLLAKHYPNMKRFIDFCEKRSTPDLMPPAQFHCFGDWVSINAHTPNEVIFLAYFAYSTQLVAESARALGQMDDAKRFEDLHAKLVKNFNDHYIDVDGTVKGDTQCSYVLALSFDLVKPESRDKVVAKFVESIEKRNWLLSTGFVGTRDIMNALTKIGRNDIALRLLHNTDFPSWGFSIKNGATSIWERWDGWTPDKGFQDPGMNSFAHYAFGAVVGWMYRELGGIEYSSPGFDTIRLQPLFDPKLDWVKASYDSVHGPIMVNWKRSGGGYAVDVQVPPNTTAEVMLKDKTEKVGSGKYHFQVN